MKKVGILILLALVFFQCETSDNKKCSTPATVRNLTGLDGCGWVFELKDGTRLEPFLGLPRCGFRGPDEKSDDPLADFEFIDGEPVLIGYEIMEDVGSYCMVGPIVKITCISEVAPSISEE